VKQRKRVFELGRELGVRLSTVIEIAGVLGLPVRRGIAQLTPRQEMLIREECDRHGWRDLERRRSEPPASTPLGNAPRYRTCECCELRFMYGDGQHSEPPRWCPSCQAHHEVADEDPERTIERHRDHEQRLRTWFEHARRSASESEYRMQMAFQSRQKWKAVLVEVVLGHEPTGDGKCTCGASETPCATVRMVESLNKGIAREVERLSGLSPKELAEQLYGKEPWRVDLSTDDDPAADKPAA